jgi:hypothetical protein
MASSSDEFDDLPDEFEGFDWNEIPALTLSNETRFPDSLDNLNVPCPASPHPSSHYSCDDEFDEAFLAAVDALEETAIQNAGTSANGM